MPGKRKRAEASSKGWKSRKKRRSSSSDSSPPTPSNRPKKFRMWSNESMEHAMEAVKSGKMGQNRAARVFGVPISTLKDRISGRVKHGTNPGPSPYLTPKEESELHDFLVKVASIGHGKTKREVITIVERTLKKKEMATDKFNGEGWWLRFMERHDKLSLRTTDPLSRVRKNAVTEENMKNYFTLLKKTLVDNDILNKPSRIFNMDETGMPLDPKQLKRVALKGTKKVQGPASGNKSQITVVASANASGHVLPPMVIFKGERFNHQWSIGEVPDTLYGMSQSGWIDSELFFYWLKKLFLVNIPPQRPVMLLLDGHSSHFTPDAISAAATEGVVIFCLPPNTTHAAQPLDVSFFKPLKQYWSSACHSFLVDNIDSVLTKFNFSRVFSVAWIKACKPETIVSGFRKTGIFPLDSSAIKITKIPTDENSSGDQGAVPESTIETTKDPPEVDNDPFLEHSFEDVVPALNNSQLHSSLQPQISRERIELFEERYENGYNLYIDQDYVKWMQFYHPEDLPEDLISPSESLTDDPVTTDSRPQNEEGQNSSSADDSMCSVPSLPTSELDSTPSQSASKGLSETRKVYSAINSFLTFPKASSTTSKGKAKKPPGRARVLTSEESLKMLEEKEAKKKEEEEAKVKRKEEREEKQKRNEAEKKRKAEERERKVEERAKKAVERQKKLAEFKEKQLQRKAEKQLSKKAEAGLPKKAKAGKVFVTRSVGKKLATQSSSSGSNTDTQNDCVVCLGKYEEDLSTDGVLLREWVQCTSDMCKKWMHESCVPKDDDDYIVCICNNVFK